MLTNYLKIALRALRKRPGLALINVLGLGLGLAASIVIALYARHELTYDRFHEEADRIYQVYKERHTPNGTQITRDTWVPLLPKLEQTYPAVEDGIRIWTEEQWVEHQGERFQENVAYTDASLLDVFTFPLRRGDPATALQNPNSVVLTPEAARKHFGDADPLGKTLTVNFDTEVTVTGVLEDLPSNSTVTFDLVVPIRGAPDYADLQDEWGSSFLSTYVLLNEAASPGDLEAQFPQLIASTWDAEEAERTSFRLEPLTGLQHALTGNRTYAYILLVVALAILVIAGINFTNLAAAQSMERAREIGVRKALGAHRRQLEAQFVGEAVLLSFMALVLGVAAAEATLPLFNRLYGIELGLQLGAYPVRGLALLGLGLTVGLAAGSYPAWILSRFEAAATLRGQHERTASGLYLRRGLVVVQFALSMVLIVGTLVVWRQVEYMKTANLRFDKEHLVTINTELEDFADPEAARSRLRTFQQEVERLSGVAETSFSSHVPGRWSNWFTFVYPGEATGDDQRLRMRYALVGDAFFDTQGVTVRQGRTFSEKRASDSTLAAVLNEAALKAFGWSSIEGKQVRIGSRHVNVIGVVENYHFQSVRNAVEPVAHFHGTTSDRMYNFLAVRFRPGAAGETMERIEEAWAAVDPSRAMLFEFADQRFRELYEREERLATMSGAFAGLAIAIACLGLLGLSALMVARRRKEVSIRKVLGASTARVATLLSADFLKLVGLAIAVAVPVAYLLMERWLQGFAVRIDLRLGLFVLAGVLALTVALVTVSTQAVRAAWSNPVDNLRTE